MNNIIKGQNSFYYVLSNDSFTKGVTTTVAQPYFGTAYGYAYFYAPGIDFNTSTGNLTVTPASISALGGFNDYGSSGSKSMPTAVYLIK